MSKIREGSDKNQKKKKHSQVVILSPYLITQMETQSILNPTRSAEGEDLPTVGLGELYKAD